MKNLNSFTMFTVALFLCFALLCSSQPPNPPAPDLYWFTQVFDHTNPSDTRTFQQRYLVYDKFWRPDGPVFFCPGGEASVMGGYNHNGFMFELGAKLGAFLLFPEHRFYGESLPFGPVKSYTRDNLKKLSVEQAMADYVQIIDFARKNWSIPETAPIIAFGGSYPGDLTVYMRVGYPDYIDAGLGSSAPLLYHAGMVPGGGFFKVCTDDFAQEDSRCPTMVQSAFSLLLTLIKTPEGRQQIAQSLQLCTVPEEEDARLIALWVENAFANLGMDNYPWPNDDMPAFPMRASCRLMVQYYLLDPLYALSQAVGVMYNASADLTCNNITDQYYPCADITGCGAPGPEAYSWDYQSCTELVSNVDTNNVTDMFPPAPYDYPSLVQYCQDTWGVTPTPTLIPSKYNYLKTSRLILSNGALDPWYAGGVLPGGACPQEQDIHCFFIDSAAHHLDLRGSDPVNDPPAVVAARKAEDEIITNWVAQIHQEKIKGRIVENL